MNSTDLVFKALADPNRRKLLEELCINDGQTLTELCEHLKVPRQAVTQLLNVLEAADLVAINWRGREKLHYLNAAPLQEIQEGWIRRFARPQQKVLRDLKHRFDNDNG